MQFVCLWKVLNGEGADLLNGWNYAQGLYTSNNQAKSFTDMHINEMTS